VGGRHPILGYDIDVNGYKLVVNPSEAERVRTIFQLYLEHQSLLPVVQELERRGWANKRWQTRKAGERGGKAFTRTSLYKLLTNVAYTGKVRYKDEIHDGEQLAKLGAHQPGVLVGDSNSLNPLVFVPERDATGIFKLCAMPFIPLDKTFP
jgi:hypothetical protein